MRYSITSNIAKQFNTVSRPVITPSHFFQYDCQPLWIWYDLFGDPQHKQPMSDFALKLLEDGVIHEKQIIRDLAATEITDMDPTKAAEATRLLMQQGEPLIYQGAIETTINGICYRGRPDLLERVEGSSIFGPWQYRPIDIKSSGSIKPLQRYQLIIYGWILDQLLDQTTEEAFIINGNGERLPVDLTNSKDQQKTAELCENVASTMQGRRPTITVTSKAKDSPWFKQMLKEAVQQDDISLIYKLDVRAVAKLRELQIETIPQLVETDLKSLPPIPYASSKRLERAQIQARSLIENRPIWISTPDLKQNIQLQLFFDIEGDPWQGVEYLFGFWVVGDPEQTLVTPETSYRSSEEDPGKYFLYFLAESPADEATLWKDFLKWTKTLPKDFVVYHYANYERSHLNRLAEKYGDSDTSQRFIDRLVDLEKTVQDSVVLPLYFYSIKDIAKSDFLGFKWRHEKAGGGQSIFWYEEWLETGNRDILNDIVNYNEDDVRATEHLYLWLLHQGNTHQQHKVLSS